MSIACRNCKCKNEENDKIFAFDSHIVGWTNVAQLVVKEALFSSARHCVTENCLVTEKKRVYQFIFENGKMEQETFQRPP